MVRIYSERARDKIPARVAGITLNILHIPYRMPNKYEPKTGKNNWEDENTKTVIDAVN